MIEQRGIPVEPGGEYVFRAWLWADEGWAPREQYLKITFYGKGGFVLGEERLDLPAIPPEWTPVELRAKAPAKATRAAVSITARGVSAYGALTIDDLSLSAESSPTP